MPFGLKNAAQAFQRLMDGMLRDVNYAFVYLDDILVASPDEETHARHLRDLFRLLESNGVSINRRKCVFGVPEVKYLGHLVTSEGIRPLPSRVKDLLSFPPPDSRVGVQRFLGMINYYRRFVPRMAHNLTPLHALALSKSKLIDWTPAADQAFKDAKNALALAVLLHHPNPFSATSITVDASDRAVGAELSQRGRDQEWRPLAFYSHSLSTTEQKYSAFDRELLAIYLAVKHFRHFLDGKPFTIFTDHKPLVFAFASATDRSPRQTRHLSYIAEFSTDVRHIKGERNIVADALSRPASVAAVTTPPPHLPSIDFSALASAQDPAAVLESSLRLQQVKWNEVTLWCDTSSGKIRPLIPTAF